MTANYLLGFANTFLTAFLMACAVMFIPAIGLSLRYLWPIRNEAPIRWEWLSGVFLLTLGLAVLFAWMAHGRYYQPVMNMASSYAAWPPIWGFLGRAIVALAFVRLMRAATRDRCGETCWIAMVMLAAIPGIWVCIAGYG